MSCCFVGLHTKEYNHRITYINTAAEWYLTLLYLLLGQLPEIQQMLCPALSISVCILQYSPFFFSATVQYTEMVQVIFNLNVL